MVEVIAQLKHVRVSPKKMRLVTDLVKGMEVDAAVLQLKYVKKNAAPIVLKLLKSAAANALHNKEIPSEKMVIKNIIVGEAFALKRWKPAAHGAAHPFKKKASHVRLVLTLKPGVTLEKKKTTKKETDKNEKIKDVKVAKKSDIKGQFSDAKQVAEKGGSQQKRASQKSSQHLPTKTG